MRRLMLVLALLAGACGDPTWPTRPSPIPSWYTVTPPPPPIIDRTQTQQPVCRRGFCRAGGE